MSNLSAGDVFLTVAVMSVAVLIEILVLAEVGIF